MADRTKILIVAGSVLVVVLILMPLLGWAFSGAGGWPAGGWGMGPWMMWGGGWWWFMPVFMVLFWGLVIWGVVALVQGLSRSEGSGKESDQQDSALEILNRRYASGEIGKEEYEEKKRDLGQP